MYVDLVAFANLPQATISTHDMFAAAGHCDMQLQAQWFPSAPDMPADAVTFVCRSEQ
jgi:hypothetical protein